MQWPSHHSCAYIGTKKNEMTKWICPLWLLIYVHWSIYFHWNHNYLESNPYCYRYPKSKSHKVQIKVGKHWLILVFLKNVLCLLIVKEASAPAAVVNNPVTEKIVSLSQSRSVLNLIVSPADHGAIYRCRSFAAPTMTRPVDSDESIVFNVTCKYFFSFKCKSQTVLLQ